MRQKLGRFCTIEFHRLAGPCRRGVSSFPDKPAGFWLSGIISWFRRKGRAALTQLCFLQPLLTFISRAFLSRALSILQSSAVHFSRLLVLRRYSSSYCFWLSCQVESKFSEEPGTSQPIRGENKPLPHLLHDVLGGRETSRAKERKGISTHTDELHIHFGVLLHVLQ